MPFYPYNYTHGDMPVMHLPASANAFRPGTMLVLRDGELVFASGADMPEYLCLYDGGGEVSVPGTLIPVEPVYSGALYGQTLMGNLKDAAKGKRCILNDRGNSVYSVGDGCALIMAIDGNSAGSKLIVCFDAHK